MRTRRGTGAATKETTFYTPLENLLNRVGRDLKPPVTASAQLKNTGAGSPDFGLFTPDQIREEDPIEGAIPSRGVVEVKGLNEPVVSVADTEQVSKYWNRYRQVLVTNYREFLLIGNEDGIPVRGESFRLADSEAEFWELSSDPEGAMGEYGERFEAYLKRVMLYASPLAAPEDVAWLLASYARDAKKRLDGVSLDDLSDLRESLEEALGLTYKGLEGDRFFRSTIVQTLFYGLFSAWVLWHRENPTRDDNFNWHGATEYLNVQVINRIFYQLIFPKRLKALGLYELVNWATAGLNRVDRATFFSKFEEGEAVQYFYEPFLQSFDPDLRHRLGVWYTPNEVVRYMVERVDTVLQDELGIRDGLADPNVLVLDPACGTGAYLAEVLRKVASRVEEREGKALVGEELKRVAMERLFGFEILTASFVIAHLQVGLLLREYGVPFHPESDDRAAIYLTNALTGWEENESERVPMFKELEAEREAADEVKRQKKVLVVLGNPPYKGHPGLAIGEERGLANAYRTTKRAPKPDGRGLNDLYVRFYRMAERQIVDQTGRGIICYITNHSWLDGSSHNGMREQYLSVFDDVWIDALHGDSRRTGKLTPEGDPDPSVFSSKHNREGIQVGTAVSLLLRRPEHDSDTDAEVRIRHFWGTGKLPALEARTQDGDASDYKVVKPEAKLGFPFLEREVSEDYLSWPQLPDLFRAFFPGVQTARDEALVDVDRKALEDRMRVYYDKSVSNTEAKKVVPKLMADTKRFEASKVRSYLTSREKNDSKIIPYSYRPFDTRWLNWEPETKLLDERREDFEQHVQWNDKDKEAGRESNLVLITQRKPRKGWTPPMVTNNVGDLVFFDPSTAYVPLSLNGSGLFGYDQESKEYNLTKQTVSYLVGLDVPEDNILYHVLSVLHAPAYQLEHEGALKQDWPRIPLPKSAEVLQESVRLGKRVACLLNEACQADGVTSGSLAPWIRTIGVPSRDGEQDRWGEEQYRVTAGWGNKTKTGTVMPGKGILSQREYHEEELERFWEGDLDRTEILGETTYDVYLNGEAYWQNVPEEVWEYKLGGYPVLKKWLSYREESVLGRPLKPEEVRHFMFTARRITALLLLHPELNASYTAVKADTEKVTEQEAS